VHVPIVLIPLVTVATIAMAIVPAWRARFGWVIVGLAATSVVGVQLATGSGEALKHHVPRTPALKLHTDSASSLRPLALLLLVLLVWFIVASTRPRAARRWLVPVLAVLASLSGIVATARLAQIGHTGAKATWQKTDMTSVSPAR
jgi:hypothetical protein